MTDATDKIAKFTDIESLKQAIREDIDSQGVLEQRYCVRFIMLNNFEVFRELTGFMAKELKTDMFELQKLTTGADKTITIDKLCDAIKGINKPSLVTPFSELVRFYKEEEFKGFFNDIILMESIQDPKKRIYIPIIGLHNRFIDFLKSFGRLEESAPIWQLYTETDDKVKVFVSKYKAPNLPDTSEYCKLDQMKDWLEFWKKQAPKEKILCSALPIRFGWKNSRPDSIFSFTEINNAYEFIKEYLGIQIPFEYKENESQHWEKMLEDISKQSIATFKWDEYVKTYFNSITFDFHQILNIWADETRMDYDRWLLKNYLMNSKDLDDRPYFKSCLQETTDFFIPSSLFVNISESIFYSDKNKMSEREKYASERRSLMHGEKQLFRKLVPETNQQWISTQIIEIAQRDADLSKSKILCTGTFDFEKEMYLGWYDQRNTFGLKDLEEFYPDLHAYINAKDNTYYKQGAEWIEEYFKAYRESKIKDRRLTRIGNFLKKYNADESTFWDWYYKHPLCHELYAENMHDEILRADKVYWIDGLGAEFIPYIQYLVRTIKSNYEIVNLQVSATGLPSNTDINRFEVDGNSTIKFGDFDEMAHKKPYQKRKTLIEELDTIRKLITRILKDNSVGNHTIAIVSDHGLSALSCHADPVKQSSKAHHDGRYIEYESDQEHDSTPEYITYTNPKNNQKYKIALTHSSLAKKPSREVHGGCTPEEVLVPFILISNIDATKPVAYSIAVSKSDIPISDPIFECVIKPQPKSAKLIVGSKKIDMERNGTVWSAAIPNPTEGRMIAGVLPHRGSLQNFDIAIYGLGMGGNSIDDDFDL